jgi:L-aspartate oxidase
MNHNYDVIIVGGGAAGLYGAIQLPSYCNVLLLCKQELTLCNSSLAQGGIAGVYKSPEDDTPELHKQDTMIAGGFKNNPETVQILVDNAAMAIDSLLKLGADFDRKPDGSLHRTLEGGHCRHRIFHHKDTTGEEIVNTLIRKVKTLSNVTILESAMMVGMQKTSSGFSVNVLQNGNYTAYNSHFMILATGGIGRMYAYTTNSKIATGDGIAFAYDNGAKIKNLHLIQFHPTAFNDHHTRECFLISEAVRGEGAYLLNCNKERFMDRYDKRLELAPRDVVSHAIIEEKNRTGSDNFYLDISHKDADFIRNRFPMIYKKVLEQGYDMTKEPIPIYPCQHYLMGGIQVDSHAETTVPNLYAAGECSNTGVHGNNRLASNSLLEALVFSRQAALDIAEKLPTVPDTFTEATFPEMANTKPMPKGTRTEIRQIMQDSFFVIPNQAELLKGFERIKEIRRMLYNEPFAVTPDLIEAKAMATNAYLILKEVL